MDCKENKKDITSIKCLPKSNLEETKPMTTGIRQKEKKDLNKSLKVKEKSNTFLIVFFWSFIISILLILSINESKYPKIVMIILCNMGLSFIVLMVLSIINIRNDYKAKIEKIADDFIQIIKSTSVNSVTKNK